MEYDRGNFDKYMSANPFKRVLIGRLNDKILRMIKRLSKNKKRAVRILDAGCGEGFITELIFGQVKNVEITGLEYVSEALEIAKKRNDKINFMQGDIYHMPFEDGAFDLVICTEVLEHLADPDAALKELNRVSGYAVLLTVPDEPWFCLGNLLTLKNVKRLGNPASHINHWTYHGFVKYVKSVVRGRVFVSRRSFPWSMILWKTGK